MKRIPFGNDRQERQEQEKQKRILRFITPRTRPKNEDLFVGGPDAQDDKIMCKLTQYPDSIGFPAM
jgi:hypothetical protein